MQNTPVSFCENGTFPVPSQLICFPTESHGPPWSLDSVKPFTLFLTFMKHSVDFPLCLLSCYHLDIGGYIDPKTRFFLGIIPELFRAPKAQEFLALGITLPSSPPRLLNLSSYPTQVQKGFSISCIILGKLFKNRHNFPNSPCLIYAVTFTHLRKVLGT